MGDASRPDPGAELGTIAWPPDDESGSHALDRELERALVRAALFDDHVAPRIGRFRVAERLGAGASSVVYAAWDDVLARRIAVKILVAETSTTRRQVKREVRALARLSHRNVVAVYEAGEWNQHAFIAMELIAGATLARWQADPARSVAELLDAYLQAGRGLAAAHQAGLVHRDFKPANVMVADDGRVAVTDFGLVRGVDGATTMTSVLSGGPRSVVGTPAYVAPEQRRGAAPHPSADLYSFAMALCEALIGWHPRQRAEPAWQHALAGRVPPRLHAAICAGLAEDPEERGLTIAPLLDAIAAAIPATHRAAATPGAQAPPRRRPRVRRAGLAAAGLVIAGLGARCLAIHQDRPGAAALASAPRTAAAPDAAPHPPPEPRIDPVVAPPPSRNSAGAIPEARPAAGPPVP
jgi:serine/threonine protein kinase